MKTRKQDSTHACYYCFNFYTYDEYVEMDRTSNGEEICNSCQIDSIVSIDKNLSTLEIEQHLIELSEQLFGTSVPKNLGAVFDFDDLKEDQYSQFDDEYYHTSKEKFTKKRDTDY